MSAAAFASMTPEEQQALLNGPALAPPAGVTSQFDNPPNKDHMAYAIYCTCFTLGSLFVFIRIYGTWFCAKKAHASDYLMVLAYAYVQIFYAAFMATIFRQVHVGYFVHQWNFRLKDVPALFYLFNIATNLFAVTIMLIKAAILLEWIRIFVPRGSRNYFFWTTSILLVVDVLFYSAAIISINLNCIPHQKIWNPLVPGHCIDSKSVDITSAAINFVIDVVVLILPQKVIWGLQMSFDKRLGVSAVFMVGFLACFAAGFRLGVTVSYSLSQDVTYTFCTVGIWVVVETTCGLMVLCVPAMPKALTDLGVTRIYTTFKSWTKETLVKKSEGSEVQLHSGNSFYPSYKTKVKAGQWTELNGTMDAVSTDYGFEPVPHVSDDTRMFQGHKTVNSNASILRTTQFNVTSEESGQNKPAVAYTNQQHIWSPKP